jgi:4-hydroxythreonine-4-phosphate dehydrogenase
VCDAIELTRAALKGYFKIRCPRIGIAALNPHAGDLGLFGKEEEDIIMPAIRRSSRAGARIVGPRPPDAIFYEAHHGRYDAVIAMYHDQGLAPLKMLYFDEGVNLTLGLPFPRTSPDHGTAFDIAGRGVANSRSMSEAMRLAMRLASAR